MKKRARRISPPSRVVLRVGSCSAGITGERTNCNCCRLRQIVQASGFLCNVAPLSHYSPQGDPLIRLSLLLPLGYSVATAKSGNNRGGTDRSQLAGAKGRPAAMHTVPFLATEMLSHFAALMGTLDPLHDTPSHSPPPSSPHCLCCRCTSWTTDAMKRRVTKALSAASE